MCPVPWASWTQFVLQSVFALAGITAMIYLIVNIHRQRRDQRADLAKWEAARRRIDERSQAALDAIGHPARTRTDA